VDGQSFERSSASCEVPLRKRAAGARFQVTLEARRGPFIWELRDDNDRPRSMLTRIAIWASVVPVEPIVNVPRAAYVMARGIAVAAKGHSDAYVIGG